MERPGEWGLCYNDFIESEVTDMTFQLKTGGSSDEER